MVSPALLDRVFHLVFPRVAVNLPGGWECGCGVGLFVRTPTHAVLHVSRFTSAVEVWGVGDQPEHPVQQVSRLYSILGDGLCSMNPLS